MQWPTLILSHGCNAMISQPLNMQKVQEEWYESLHNWDEAYNLYQKKAYLHPDDPNLTLGKMRCLSAMGEWYATIE